jgi:U3 small nucleolar RNA-associated protein 10
LFRTLEAAEKALAQPNLDQETEDSYLYVESICLGSLLSIYKQSKVAQNQKLDQSQFNIELLMQILQTKRHDGGGIDDTRVQEQVLLLLSEIAGLFPDKVLEHVLIMFVFVGNRLARQDDSYSFQIITKIIRTILPSIVSTAG